MRAEYRPDIDGLRAVAVLAVVAFHAFPTRAPGGFIGVDVFFVISGFLISGVILDGLARDRFSLAGFYGRRVRRIFPALTLVLAVYLAGGWFAMPPAQYAHLGKHSFFGSAFVANLSLWREGGYFDGPIEIKPLLHLWSLGIEEQFYLVWPAGLLLLTRRRVSVLGATTILTLASFALNVYEAPRHPTATFYMPLTRFWEILLGGVLASAVRRPGGVPWPSWMSPNVRAWSGLALLVLGGVLLDDQAAFPGWWAALPTMGAALLIAAGPSAVVNRRLLSHPVMVFIGLISYPLYLWHWPLLHASLLPVRFLQSPWAAVAAAIFVSWLTYRLWERPLRTTLPSRTAIAGLVSAAVCIAAIGAAVWAKDGLPGRLSPEMSRLLTKVPTQSIWRYRTCFLDMDAQSPSELGPDCVETAPASAPLVAIWGDSHGAELYAGLRALQARGGFRLAQLTASMCPPLVGEAAAGPRCTALRADMSQRIARAKPSTVVLSSAWQRDGPRLEEKLAETVAFLRGAGVATIIIVGPPPKWVPTLPFALFQEFRVSGRIAERLPADAAKLAVSRAIEVRLRAISSANNTRYVSPIDTLCDARGCLTHLADTLPDGLVSNDGEHLSVAGITFVAERALAPILLRVP